MEWMTSITVFINIGLMLGFALLAYLSYRYSLKLSLLERKIRNLDILRETLLKALGKALESYEAEKVLKELRKRVRRRYIVFVVASESTPPPLDKLSAVIEEKLKEFSGVLGIANTNTQLVYYDEKKGIGVLRTNYTSKYIVLAALGLVRRINGKRTLIIPIATTGTIKRARKLLATLSR